MKPKVLAARGLALALLLPASDTRAASTNGWQTVPLGGGGYVIGLVAHPTAGGPIYCRTDVGGAFRWDAANSQWIAITDTIVPVSTTNAGDLSGIPSLAIDPANTNQVYVAAGVASAALHGIFSSGDQGATWTQINASIAMDGNGAFRTVGERLAVDPNDTNVLWYGSSQDGLQKGTRSGGVWTWTQVPATSVPPGQVASDDKAGVTFVACDKNGTNTILYAGVYDAVSTNGGVYTSPDGTKWTLVPGMVLATPERGQVAGNGTLYVTAGTAGVARLPRGGALTAITPAAGINYLGVAVDPSDPTGNALYVAEKTSNQYGKIWRSIDGGATWSTQYLNFNNLNYTRTEPDGTPSLTGYWFGSVAALLVNPANANELWASDFFGVYRTRDAQDLGTANGAFWYLLQKGQEETCVETLKCAPTGAPLLIGVADVGGYRYLDTTVRPYGATGNSFRNPSGGSTISLDFSERDNKVWARTWVNGPHDGGSGAASSDGGTTWLEFGQVAVRTVTNSAAAGAETWDLSTYLSKQEAKGVDTVTLILCSGQATSNSTSILYFDSREAVSSAVWPKLVINGATTLTPVADAYVADGATNTNYGTTTNLAVSYAYGNSPYTRWTCLKFDLSSVGAIASATLQLNRRSASNAIQFPVGVYACANTSWTESAVTWATRPGPLAGGGNPVGDPRYYDGATPLRGGRIAVSSADPDLMVWMPEGFGKLPRYSDDRGVSWTVCSGAPASQMYDQFNPGVIIQQLTADRVNGAFYMAKFSGAGSGNHAIYRSTDGGATWALCGTVSAGTYNVYRAQIVAAPAANDVWVSDDGVNGTTKGGLWRSTDGGSTWGAKVTGLTAVRQVAFGKAQSGLGYTVFVNGYKSGVHGVYRSDDYGATWVRLADSPTIVDIAVLAGDRQAYGRAYIGTGGRGVFQTGGSPPDVAAWFGAGGNASWNDSANWSGGQVPDSEAVAVFTAAGLTNNEVVTLDSTQAIHGLTIATLTNFTIGRASGDTASTLTVTEVVRQDVAGAEGIQTIAAPVVLSGTNSPWTVDGSGWLAVSGAIGGTAAVQKLGVGVLRLTGSNTCGSAAGLAVLGGTLLVDNGAGSGTGCGSVNVGAFGGTYATATLGGTGFMGGVSGSAGASVVLGTSGTNLATLAPGTIDPATGAHVIGTFTVGSVAQSHNVTFGDGSRLLIAFDRYGVHDQFVVHGSVDLGSTLDRLDLAMPPEGVPTGTYTLVSADAITGGAFETVTGLPVGAVVQYTPASVRLVVPPLAPASSNTCIWTGGPGGSGTSWNVAANWDVNRLPGSDDAAVFGDAGLTNKKIIALDAAQTVRQLTIAATNAFAIGSANDVAVTNTLTLASVIRQDIPGTEGVHTLAARIALSTNSTWTVDGSNYLNATGGISGAFSLTKQGAAELRVGTDTYSGDTTVLAGPLTAMAQGAIQGNLVVGSTGGVAASFSKNFTPSPANYDTIANGKNVTVYSTSTVSLFNAENVNSVTLCGGTISCGSAYINNNIYMTGGTLSGSLYGNHSTVTTYSNATTALISAFNSTYLAYAPAIFAVADGPALIDLECSGTMSGGNATKSLTKSGAGVMLLSAAGGNSYSASNTIVGGGTLLLGNASGSGTGTNPVQVNAGATLGGTGIVGGVTGAVNANITLSGVSSNRATLAPGTVQSTIGDHVIGTFTVGSAAQTNNVVFGAYSRLWIRFAPDGSHDQLVVHGALNLASTSDRLELSFPPGGVRGGLYTLASADVIAGGSFDQVAGLPAGARVEVDSTAVRLRVPPAATTVQVR